MITVKPLEWNKYDEAVGFDCRYTVYQGGDGWTCVKYPHGDSHYRLAEGVPEADARAVAFADYSARIMSAIEPAGVGVETMEDIHRDQLARDRLKPAGGSMTEYEREANKREAARIVRALRGATHD